MKGRWVWCLKDHIDRGWMRQFHNAEDGEREARTNDQRTSELAQSQRSSVKEIVEALSSDGDDAFDVQLRALDDMNVDEQLRTQVVSQLTVNQQ